MTLLVTRAQKDVSCLELSFAFFFERYFSLDVEFYRRYSSNLKVLLQIFLNLNIFENHTIH